MAGEEEGLPLRKVTILDTTLRDGEQSPGLAFTIEEKVEIAGLLASAGVREIEAGIPVMGGDEARACKEIADMGLPCRVFTWNRAQIKDIEASLSCGISSLFISCPVSDIHIEKKLGKTRGWVIERFSETIPFARREGCYTVCGLEDAVRADMAFLKEICTLVEELGASRIRLCDTVGLLTPLRTFRLISEVKSHLSIPVEFHGHNDLGMATANTISAFEAGAEVVDTTILGIGERAGNAPLEEVVMAFKYLLNTDTGIDISALRGLSLHLAQIINSEISPWKPIVGENAFVHESALHVEGVLKEPSSYEPFPPEEIGTERKFIIGKHSNRRILKERLRNLGVAPEAIDLSELIKEIRYRVAYRKISFPDDELLSLIYFEPLFPYMCPEERLLLHGDDPL